MKQALVCLALLTLLAAQAADAQSRCRGRCDGERDRDRVRVIRMSSDAPIEFGIRGGYDFEDNSGLAGAQIRIPLADQLLVVPSGDVFFEDAATEWQVNADVVLRPGFLAGLYAGGGVAFVNRTFGDEADGDTRTGYNLLVGLDGGQIRETSLRPFVEGRWTEVDDYDPFRLILGINVPIARGFGR